MIHARIDPELKKAAERVFSTLGLSTTEAIRLFMKQVEQMLRRSPPCASQQAGRFEALSLVSRTAREPLNAAGRSHDDHIREGSEAE